MFSKYLFKKKYWLTNMAYAEQKIKSQLIEPIL